MTHAAAKESAPAYTLAQFQGDEELGAGSFGVVKRVVNGCTGDVFAMKQLEKDKVIQRGLQEQLKREVLTQIRVKHENVVRLHYYFEDSARIYLLLEFADRGTLFAFLPTQGGRLLEPRAVRFFSDTARGLDYLHGLRIVHRDLKPENVLLFGEELRAKLGDFGWCVGLTAEEPTRRTFCGTMDYISPEMLNAEPHDANVDLWALGVLLYEMLVGKAPFESNSQKETIDRICEGRYEVAQGSMSQGAEDLIRGLLRMRQFERTRLAAVLRHPWLVQGPKGSGDEGEDLAATRACLRNIPPPPSGLDKTCVVPRRQADPPAAVRAAAPGPLAAGAAKDTAREANVLSSIKDLHPYVADLNLEGVVLRGPADGDIIHTTELVVSCAPRPKMRSRRPRAPEAAA